MDNQGNTAAVAATTAAAATAPTTTAAAATATPAPTTTAILTAVDTNADSGSTTDFVPDPSVPPTPFVEVLRPLSDEHCPTGVLLRLSRNRSRSEQVGLIEEYTSEAPALAQDIVAKQREANVAGARLLAEEHAQAHKDLQRRDAQTQTSSTAAQRSLH